METHLYQLTGRACVEENNYQLKRLRIYHLSIRTRQHDPRNRSLTAGHSQSGFQPNQNRPNLIWMCSIEFSAMLSIIDPPNLLRDP